MKLTDLLEKEEYENLKFEDALYDEKTNVTTFSFLHPRGYEVTNDLRENLKNDLLQMVGELSKIKIKFKQSYLDDDILFKTTCDFISAECPYLKGFAEKEDFHLAFDEDENTVNITIDCDSEMADILKTYRFLEALKNKLEKSLFEKVKLKLNVCKTASKKQTTLEKTYAMQLEEILEQEKFINKMEVDEVACVVGKVITQSPVFISDLVGSKEQQVLAGKLTNPQMSFFVPRAHKDIEEVLQHKKFSFELVDASGSIKVVMFPNDKDAEKLEKLTEGCEILIAGKTSEFNGIKNFRAFDLSVCRVLTKELKYLWREPIKDYKTVFPKPMEEVEQMSLFGAANESVSDYWKNDKQVVVFDFETTGLNADNCKIIEIGAVKVKNGKCIETFSTLVNPHEKLDEEIVNLTGIDDEMLVFAPEIEDVLPDFHKFCQNCTLSAYNIGFDIKFLLNAGKKFRFKFDNERLDTLELVRKKVPSLPNYKLSSAVKALNVTLEEAHRALNDAIATAKVFIKLV